MDAVKLVNIMYIEGRTGRRPKKRWLDVLKFSDIKITSVSFKNAED